MRGLIMARFDAIEADPYTTTERGRSTITELVAGILEDAQTLIRQQFAMLRAELKEEISKTAHAGLSLVIGVIAASLSALFFTIGLVYLLNWVVPSLPLWSCWMIVAAPIALGGVLMFAAGWRKMQAVTAVPEKSLNALQENISWIANPQNHQS